MGFGGVSMWYSLAVGAAWKGSAVIGVAWIAARALGRRSAAMRHIVWTGAFAALVALPPLSVSLPGLGVPLARVAQAPGAILQATAVTRQAGGGALAQPDRGQGLPAPYTPSSLDWRWALLMVWAAGAAAMFTKLAVGWVAIHRIRRASSPCTDVDASVARVLLGIRRRVDILEMRREGMPMTLGFWRPAVLVPVDAAAWSGERRRVVLLHEFAHVARRDVASHLVARASLSLYWWNPLAWMAWRAFLIERERAADDVVLRAGVRASDYARHLLDIARALRARPEIDWAGALAMARPSQLEGRLRAILDAGVNRSAPARASIAVAAALACAIVAPVAALRGQDEQAQAVPADVDAAIRSARAQRNFAPLDTAAQAAEAQRKFDIERKLLEASLAIRGEVSGARSASYGAGLARLGDFERQYGDRAAALADYRQAVAALGARAEAARPLIHLGAAALSDKNDAKAIEYFERARLADPANPGPAAMWMAVVRDRQGNPDEARALFREALAVQPPDSLDAMIAMTLYASSLGESGLNDAATAMRDRINQARQALSARALLNQPRPSPDVYRIGNGVTAPVPLSRPDPGYSEEARVAKYQGTVVIATEVWPDGLAHNVLVTRSLGLGLDEKATDAISQWRFKPGTKDGQPVKVRATIEVNFRLL